YYGTALIGTTRRYDELNRVTTSAPGVATPGNIGPSTVSYAYDDSAGTVTITDENGKQTRQTRRAFGDPDDTRLVSIRDAIQNDWNYSYDTIGHLRKVAGPVGPNGEVIERRWEYNPGSALLRSEFQPESGVTEYLEYDGVGHLRQMKDASGTVFSL